MTKTGNSNVVIISSAITLLGILSMKISNLFEVDNDLSSISDVYERLYWVKASIIYSIVVSILCVISIFYLKRVVENKLYFLLFSLLLLSLITMFMVTSYWKLELIEHYDELIDLMI